MKQQALLSDDTIIVGHVILEPGETRAPEIHSDMSETIVMLRGGLMLRGVGHSSVRLGDGHLALDAAFVEAGTEHDVANASATEPAEFLAIMRMRKVPT